MSIPRVLFLDHTAQLGGGEIALVNLITHLDRTRYQAMVMLFSDGPLRHQLENAGVPVKIVLLDPTVANTRKGTLGYNTFLQLRDIKIAALFTWRLRQMIRESRVDLVHTNSLKADVLGGIAARLAGVPVVWHVRDRIADDYLPASVVTLFRILCRLIPTQIITNSTATLQTLGRQLAKRSVVVHSGVSVVHDGTLLHESVEPQHSHFGKEQLTIGLVARLTQWKGQHVFLEAASIVKAQFPQAKFQLIGAALFGEDAYEEELRHQVTRLHLTDSVEFMGFRKDVSQLVQKIDVLVHASTTGEPFGQVIIEGMAAGKPVVATNGGGVPEIVVHEVTGLLVPMGDAHAMAEAICEILHDPARATAMGQAGFERVRERFLARHTGDAVMRVFDEILLRSSSRDGTKSAKPPRDHLLDAKSSNKLPASAQACD